MIRLLLFTLFSAGFLACSSDNPDNEASAAADRPEARTARVASGGQAGDQLEMDKKAIEKHLKEKGIEDYRTTASGIYYTVENPGEGAAVEPGMKVTVHYTGTLLDGSVFDSSVERGQPFSFVIGQGRVIKGWDEGIPLFRVGGEGTLYIPSTLAYGSRGRTGIPANSILIFEIEVLHAVDAVAEAVARKKAQREKIEAFAETGGWDVQFTDSGLGYVVEKPGTGEQAAAGKTVSVHYTGSLLSGEVFDSSVDKGEPITFPLGAGRVIQGWDEGLALFKQGGKGHLLIPSHMGYGEREIPGRIPANSVLVFEIEIIEVQ